MKAHQFIRSANCYYKLQGEILLNIQFACYDTPARICFCAQPYWVLDGWIGNDRPNVHNHWCWFDGDIADVLAVLDPVSVEQNTYNRFDRASVERFFEQLGERFQKYLFPALERMTDFENYFREVSAFHPNGTMIPSVVLRYCAIKDGDYQRFLRYREQYEAYLNAFRNSASGKMSPSRSKQRLRALWWLGNRNMLNFWKPSNRADPPNASEKSTMHFAKRCRIPFGNGSILPSENMTPRLGERC